MKMGLGLMMVGHVNFLLGALVHGAVLRHINVHSQARIMEYAVSNVIAIVAGLLVSALRTFVFCQVKLNYANLIVMQWMVNCANAFRWFFFN